MLLPPIGVGMNSAMDDMNLIQQAQRLHVVVKEIGLKNGHGEDDPSFGEEIVSQLSIDAQDLSHTQQVKRKKMVVKRSREEWADTYKWAYVDVKDGTPRIFCSVCREFGRKQRRNPYGNEGSHNTQMNALEEYNNCLLHKEAFRLQSTSKDKIMARQACLCKSCNVKNSGINS